MALQFLVTVAHLGSCAELRDERAFGGFLSEVDGAICELGHVLSQFVTTLRMRTESSPPIAGTADRQLTAAADKQLTCVGDR